MSHYTMLNKYGERTRKFFGRFYFYFSLVFYLLSAFLMKQLLLKIIHSWAKSYSLLHITNRE